MQKSNTVRVEPFDFAFHPVRPERSGAESKDERYAQDRLREAESKDERSPAVVRHFDSAPPRAVYPEHVEGLSANGLVVNLLVPAS